MFKVIKKKSKHISISVDQKISLSLPSRAKLRLQLSKLTQPCKRETVLLLFSASRSNIKLVSLNGKSTDLPYIS